MVKRNISPGNELIARRLKKAVDNYKKANETTNREMAKVVGIGENLFSQYMNNHTNITRSALEKICRMMGIEPDLIDPDFAPDPMAVMVPVIGSMTNNMPLTTCTRIRIKYPKQGLIAVESDMVFVDGHELPGYIVVDTDTPPRPGDFILFRRRDNAYFHQGQLAIYMRDLITIKGQNGEMYEIDSIEKLAWIAKIHEFHTP